MLAVEQGGQCDPLAELSRFRGNVYDCLTSWRDALFELTGALLCTDGPVKTWWAWRSRPSTVERTERCTAP